MVAPSRASGTPPPISRYPTVPQEQNKCFNPVLLPFLLHKICHYFNPTSLTEPRNQDEIAIWEAWRGVAAPPVAAIIPTPTPVNEELV